MDTPVISSQHTYQSSFYKNIGYTVWIIFAILSIIFYKERAAFMDGAFQLVDLINTGQFSIHHYRITNPLTQIFAWVGVKSGLPLRYIMIGYSFNFILFHFIIYHLIVNWCKNHYLGLVQIGFFTIFVTQSFYFLPPEFYQGMSILLLWTAIFMESSFDTKKWKTPLLSILLIPIIFDHALLSIFFIFIWLFLWLHDHKYRNWNFFGFLILMIGVYIIHDMYFTGWYDEARKGHFWRHWNEYYPNFFNIPGHKIFLARCIDTYYLFPILLTVVIAGYIRSYFVQKSTINSPILKLILIIGFCFFFLMINHINDPKTPFLFYSQVNYIGLAIPLMVALCFDFLPDSSHKKVIVYLFALIVLVRIASIIYASKSLIERHDCIIDTINIENTKKIYANSGDAPKEMLIQTWAIPEESLLLTSLKGSENSATLLIKRYDYKYLEAIDSTHVLLRSHSVQPLIELNSKYFLLGNGIYKEVKVKDCK